VVIEPTHGKVIGGRYQLQYVLGKGGMGTVWAAVNIESGESRAVKLMNDADDEKARKRFLREGRAAASIQHPSVVTIFEVIDVAGQPPAIVMELLKGESLRDLFARQRQLALGEVADIMMQVCSAVGEAHARGIIHRDLKPENIFLVGLPGEDRVARVLDFGIAKWITVDRETLRTVGGSTNAVIGTVEYMAPEQVYGERDLDHRADIWALGIVLYEGLSGICPTAGAHMGQVLKHVLHKPLVPVQQLVPRLPDSVAQTVDRMLRQDPSDRPADLREIVDVLKPFARVHCIPFGPPSIKIASAWEPEHVTEAPGDRSHGLTASRWRTVRHSLVPIALRLWRPRTFVGVLLLAALLVIAPVPQAGRSPLTAPDARLACPVLRAGGVDEPSGWLGAAAASIACERARIILGGTDRTLVPAELLELPRGPTKDFPQDPFGQGDSHERSLLVARRLANAYLDGEVNRTATGFSVSLSLHRADGSRLKTGAGQGKGLYEAVRNAMTPLVDRDAIPRSRALDARAAAWAFTDNVEPALASLDLIFAIAQNAGVLADECKRFDRLSPQLAELGIEGRLLCAYSLGGDLPDLKPATRTTAIEQAAAQTVVQIRLDFMQKKTAPPVDPARLRALFEREATSRGKAQLAAIESCTAADPQAARERAIVAVQAEPRSLDGGLCNAWEQLMTLERGTTPMDGTVRAWQAWAPWNSYAWLEPGFRPSEEDPSTVTMLWRAHRLSPHDVQITESLAGYLLTKGEREQALGLAGELRSGAQPNLELESEMIWARVESSEATFGSALEHAMRVSSPREGETGWILAQRFEIGWRAFEIGLILGRGREVADQLVAGYLVPDRPRIDTTAALLPLRMPAICMLASEPRGCLQRFRGLRRHLGTATQDTDALLDGVDRYMAGEIAAAARIWSPLVRGSKLAASTLPAEMVLAFEQIRAYDLAEQVDSEVMKRAGEYHGATLGHVRSARRAHALGDSVRARHDAELVVKAWATADQTPPAVSDMRALLQPP
jgi:serine/threonine protein kinase